MTIDEAINNLKRGKCIPYKHKTLTLVIESLDAWEKAKKEIDGLMNDSFSDSYDNGVLDCLEVIDKHLSELRGDTE